MAANEPEESGFTRYRVTWTLTGTDKPRTTYHRIYDRDRKRPSDPGERDALLRQLIADALPLTTKKRWENVTLLDVVPLCNCSPHSGENCAYAGYGGERFSLVPATVAGWEAIRDRHGDEILGAVHSTLSVEFLTLVRNKYDHQ